MTVGDMRKGLNEVKAVYVNTPVADKVVPVKVAKSQIREALKGVNRHLEVSAYFEGDDLMIGQSPLDDNTDFFAEE